MHCSYQKAQGQNLSADGDSVFDKAVWREARSFGYGHRRIRCLMRASTDKPSRIVQ